MRFLSEAAAAGLGGDTASDLGQESVWEECAVGTSRPTGCPPARGHRMALVRCKLGATANDEEEEEEAKEAKADEEEEEEEDVDEEEDEEEERGYATGEKRSWKVTACSMAGTAPQKSH